MTARGRPSLTASSTMVLLAVVIGCDGDLRLPDAAGDSGVVREDGGAASRDAPAVPRPACTTDAVCGAQALHCDASSGACVECTSDVHCSFGERKRCDAASHRCVACGVTSDCGVGSTCEPTTRKCVPKCDAATACPTEAPTCDLARDICVACTVSSSCEIERPHCENASGRCVECLEDTDCVTSGHPRCDKVLGQCVECLNNDECGSPPAFCDPPTGECH